MNSRRNLWEGCSCTLMERGLEEISKQGGFSMMFCLKGAADLRESQALLLRITAK